MVRSLMKNQSAFRFAAELSVGQRSGFSFEMGGTAVTNLNMRKLLVLTFGMVGLTLSGSVGLAAPATNTLPLTLRIGTFNVGHFNQGKLGGYQEGDVAAALERWRSWIKAQSFDVFFINEWNLNFDKDGTLNATEHLLQPFYDHIVFGKRNTWIYNGMASNFPISKAGEVPLTHQEYYAVRAEWPVGGVTVTLMSVHVPWQKDAHDSSIDALITEMKRHKYLICAGDLNAPDRNVLKIKAAGFKVANGGDEGWFCTAASKCGSQTNNVHIDNIITSPNLTIKRVSAPRTGLNDLDHLPLRAEVTLE